MEAFSLQPSALGSTAAASMAQDTDRWKKAKYLAASAACELSGTSAVTVRAGNTCRQWKLKRFALEYIYYWFLNYLSHPQHNYWWVIIYVVSIYMT